MWSALGDIIGLPLKQAGPSKVLPCRVLHPQLRVQRPYLSLFPHSFSKTLKDLSNILAGGEGEGKPLKMGKFPPPQKTKMGRYKVPRSVFDYAPAILDPFLTELGSKESVCLTTHGPADQV